MAHAKLPKAKPPHRLDPARWLSEPFKVLEIFYMATQFEARTLHPILLMEIDPKQTEKAVWVLSESDRFADIISNIAEQFPGWQFGEWAEWLGHPLKGEVVEFPMGAIAA